MTPIDWTQVGIVIFDVDGTLYSQRALRARIFRDLLLYCLRHLDWSIIRTLAVYRDIREGLSDSEMLDFESVLIERTAQATQHTQSSVRAAVDEWIERRPLPYLRVCRYPRVAELFEGLRRHGKIVGILSDYPARAKVGALGLIADVIVAAGDQDVRCLKPSSRGLEVILAATGIRPEAALMIGDRVERDGCAAARIGMPSLIRASQPITGWRTFKRFDDPVFTSLLSA